MKGNAEVMRCFRTGFVKLRGRDIQNIIAGQNAGAAFHGFDVDGEIFGVGADDEILAPVLAVGGAEGTGRAGKVIAVGEDDFPERACEAHHTRLREAVFTLIPNVRDVMMNYRVVYQLTSKMLLLVADGDLNIRAVVQNNLLHANLMASRVSIKPIKMIENGT